MDIQFIHAFLSGIYIGKLISPLGRYHPMLFGGKYEEKRKGGKCKKRKKGKIKRRKGKKGKMGSKRKTG